MKSFKKVLLVWLLMQAGWAVPAWADSMDDADAARSRLVSIADRANSNFALLGAELALQKGEVATALATYMATLKKTRDAEVAERAMEMAIGVNALPQAEEIYRLWTEIQPEPSTAQKRLAWMRDMLKGAEVPPDVDFEGLLQGATQPQVRRIFLLTAQTALRQPVWAKNVGKQVHKAALKRRDVPEALIADAIFSAMNNHDDDAVDALKQLAKLDSKILPPTMLTIRLIAQNKPEVVSRFFAETETNNLSEQWQELQIHTLIQIGKIDQATELVRELLSVKPHPILYIQAAYLAITQNKPQDEVLGYLNQAMQGGTQEEQSRAALMAAMYLADIRKDYAAAKVWLAKVGSETFRFDTAVLSAMLAAQDQDWKTALSLVKKAQRLPEKEGSFYNQSILQRISIYAQAHGETPQRAIAALSKIYQQALNDGDDDVALDALRQRGLVYVNRLNRADLAVADFERYLKTDPNNSDVMNELGYTMLYLPKADVEKAFQLIEAAFQQDPQSPYINDSMGWVYFKKGDLTNALPYLEYAYQETPLPEVAAHLGEVLWVMGEKERAMQIFREGLKQKDEDRSELLRTIKRLGVRLPKAAKR